MRSLKFCDESGSLMDAESDTGEWGSCGNETPRGSKAESTSLSRDGQQDDAQALSGGAL
jgi:hypothetical protein